MSSDTTGSTPLRDDVEVSPPSTESTQAAGTLARGLDILEWVAAHERAAIAAVAAELGLSRSATYRIVGQLRDRGYLVDAGEAHVRLGPTAIRIGLQALEGLDLFRVAPDHLRALVAQTSETVFVAVPESDEMAYVMQEVGPQVVKVSSKLGSRAPMHASALGKAFLSALPADRRATAVDALELTAYTPTTLDTREALLAALDEAAERGFALDDAEREPGVRCLAAPIRGADHLPVAAISVAGPQERIRPAEAAIAAAVRDTADRISRQLGDHDHHPDQEHP